MIEKVVLKFIGTGINNEYQACVRIYDTFGNLLYKGKTYNGKIELLLEKNKVYNLIAISYGEIIRISFIVRECNNKLTFYFNRSVFNNNTDERTITFLLTDANYNNLPIEKGEIVLWQNQ